MQPIVPAGKTRSTKSVEGGYCPDTRRREKLQEKEAQYEALEETFRCHGYNGTTQPVFVWRGGGEGGAYTGFIQACICVHGVHACFGSCSLDTFMVPEDESYRASVEWI